MVFWVKFSQTWLNFWLNLAEAHVSCSDGNAMQKMVQPSEAEKQSGVIATGQSAGCLKMQGEIHTKNCVNLN